MASTAIYSGSCHCGTVKFTAKLDLINKGTTKCNCTICQKTRSWEGLVEPEDFAITAGKDNLTEYRFGSKTFPHYFCQTCGVHTHLKGTIPGLGDQVMIQVHCLDNVEPSVLGSLPIRYINNLDGKPQERPEYVQHL